MGKSPPVGKSLWQQPQEMAAPAGGDATDEGVDPAMVIIEAAASASVESAAILY